MDIMSIAVAKSMVNNTVEEIKEKFGAPLVSSTSAGMTDQSRVYVYTGNESGFLSGHWYYYNGSMWTDGGVYNAVAVETDTTLSVSGKAADGKAVGDQLSDVMSEISYATDNLLDFETDGFWEMKDLDGTSRAYAATTVNKIPVTAGDELYTALNNLSQDIFGNRFLIKVRYYDNSDTQVGSDWVYSTITSQNPVHYTIPSGTAKIAVMLTTNDWQKTFTLAQLKELNPLIYVGFNSNITNDTVYHKQINKIKELENGMLVVEELNRFASTYHSTINLFDKKSIYNDHYMRVVDGALVYSQYAGMYYTTDYIPVASGDYVVASRDGIEIPAYNYTFFNTSKEWLGTLYGSKVLANGHPAPEDGYIRLSFETDVAPKDYLMVQITSKKSASPFEPYGKVGITYDEFEPRLSAVEEVLSTPVREMFLNEAEETAQAITEAITSKCVIFSIVTDEHYNDVKNDGTNRLTSVYFDCVRSIRYVNNIVPSNVVVDLGDRTNEGVHDANLALQQDMIKALRTTNPHVMAIIGNHDWNGTTQSEILSENELYAISQQFNEEYVVRDGLIDNAYMDFPYAKVRAIFYNTFGCENGGVYQTIGKNENKTWLANVALNTPDDYTIVFMSHSTIKNGFSFEETFGGDDVIGILKAYATQSTYTDSVTSAVYDFTGKSGTKVACCISGHTHEDNIYQDENLPFPFVGIGCEKYENGNPNAEVGNPSKPTRERGKAIEDLWETVIVLPSEKKVKFIRFGAGSNREITYV